MKLNKTQKSKVALAIYRLKSLQSNIDIELAHAEADDILCAVLEVFGLSEIVEEYNKIEKMYA